MNFIHNCIQVLDIDIEIYEDQYPSLNSYQLYIYTIHVVQKSLLQK